VPVPSEQVTEVMTFTAKGTAGPAAVGPSEGGDNVLDPPAIS
jgi:hypothetical protein